MNALAYLQPLASTLSAVLLAISIDIGLRLLPQARDRMLPLFGLPAKLALSLNRKLNRQERGRDTRYNRGIFTLFALIILGLILGFLGEISTRQDIDQIISIEPVLWFLCFQVTFPWTAGTDLRKSQNIGEGMAILERRQINVLVPATNPDKHAIIRMFIEATATSLHRGFLSPVFWAIIVKLFHGPALLAAILVTTILEAERVLVKQDTANTPFVTPFQLAEAVINFIPARIAAFFWALGAFFTPKAKPFTALRAMFVQSAAHRAVNSGWPVAAVAGALNIALPGGKKRDLWVGANGATAKAENSDISRAIFLHAVTLGLTILVLMAMLVLSIAA